MNPQNTFIEVGADIGKTTFDTALNNKTQTWANTAKGIHAFLKWIEKQSPLIRITCESTGGYVRLLTISCLRKNIPISVVNARAVRDFAKATGELAKTDRIDARTHAS
ncbi:MAG: transposase [Chthoniobacterales bacterium]